MPFASQERRREYDRQRYLAKREALPLHDVTCSYCGTVFKAMRRDTGTPRYCSNSCRSLACQKRRREAAMANQR